MSPSSSPPPSGLPEAEETSPLLESEIVEVGEAAASASPADDGGTESGSTEQDSEGGDDSKEFNTRKVLLSAGEILLERPLAVLGVSAVLQSPQLLVPVLVERGVLGGGPDPASVMEILVFYFVLFFLGQLQAGLLAPLALARLWGGSISLGESLKQALERPFALALTAALWAFFATIGLGLLIVPGFVVMTLLFPAIPALFVERLSPVQALARGAQLTRGRMFSLLALVIIFSIAERGIDLAAAYFGLPEVVPAALAVVLTALAALCASTAYHFLRMAPPPTFALPAALRGPAKPARRDVAPAPAPTKESADGELKP